jgi:Tfp pilus assembly protein PilF/Zn-dependent protease
MISLLKQSWRLVRIHNLAIYVQFSCIVSVLAWVPFLMLFQPLRGLPALILPFGIYLSVLLHEIAHTLIARHYKMEVYTITLHGLGGYSQIESPCRRGIQLLEVSIAGSLLHFLLFITFSLGLRMWPDGSFASIQEHLRWMNLALGCGSLLPIFPLDGSYAAQAVHWLITGKPSPKIPWIKPSVANGVGLLSLGLGLFCCSQSWIGLGIGLILLGLWMGAGYLTRQSLDQIQESKVGKPSLRKQPFPQQPPSHRTEVSPKHSSIKDFTPSTNKKLESLYLDPFCLIKEEASDLFQQGLTYAQDLCFPEMVDAFSKAIALNPTCAIAYHNRGCAYFQTGDPRKALADFKDALRLAPNCAESHLGRGTASIALGDLPGAIMDFDAAIALDTENARAYFNRATTYMALGNRKAAIADYHQAEIRFSAQKDETMLRQVNHCLQLLDTHFGATDAD